MHPQRIPSKLSQIVQFPPIRDPEDFTEISLSNQIPQISIQTLPANSGLYTSNLILPVPPVLTGENIILFSIPSESYRIFTFHKMESNEISFSDINSSTLTSGRPSQSQETLRPNPFPPDPVSAIDSAGHPSNVLYHDKLSPTKVTVDGFPGKLPITSFLGNGNLHQPLIVQNSPAELASQNSHQHLVCDWLKNVS
jgi:hypothetical protein